MSRKHKDRAFRRWYLRLFRPLERHEVEHLILTAMLERLVVAQGGPR